MHSELPAILKCLYCGQAGLKLAPNPKLAQPNGIETVIEGAVVCPKCGSRYPIQDGIVNFLSRRTPNIGIGQFTNQFKLTAWGYERYWRPKALTLMGGREWPPAEEFATLIRMLNTLGATDIPTHNGLAFYFDQGCSTCFYSRAIIRAHKEGKLNTATVPAHVVAVDNSWVMLQEARQFIEKDGLSGHISLIRADVEKLPFIDKAFAGTASGGSLNEFKHSEPALSEANRTLDPQAQAVFMVQMAADGKVGELINKFITLSSGIKFFQPDQLLKLFQQAGFRLVEQQSGGIITINHLVRL
jgi:SAM-dependent methyltransferase/uncharacterized protein YbaR (Trm112 family)